ncbi:MAG: SAM-dependent methyltransferase [Clostridia bacterium]
MNTKIIEYINSESEFALITISAPLSKDLKYKKITIRPLKISNVEMYQAENFTSKQVFHENINMKYLSLWIEKFADGYKQYVFITKYETITYLVSEKGHITKRISKNDEQRVVDYNHDKQKNYILQEGVIAPALVDLGVFDSDGKLIKAMSDKFRQIDRFVRIVDDAVKNLHSDTWTILDFGCGKSYLTFIMYHYFTTILHKKVTMIGYDLKQEVVEKCNQTAEKYGYNDLKFYVNDINGDVYDKNVDIIMSLHACDRATDATLSFAIKHNVPYIFSVPCCQHELNSTIEQGGDLDIFFGDGIIKDRVCALLTDALRVKALECFGYDVSVLEFVEFAHSPKNLMIRAQFNNKRQKKSIAPLIEFLNKYGAKQTLLEELNKIEG